MDKKDLATFLWGNIIELILKINLKKRIKKDSKESFKINIKYDDLCIRVKIL